MFEKILNSKQTPFWLITFSTLIGLTLPKLIMDGMFMDAMLYTSVAHNLSHGIGTFWFPQFSVLGVSQLPAFHEQPPLVFGIQALFFKVFGDSIYVERLYTFITMCTTAILINKLWKDIFKNNIRLKKIGWLPIILWITIPICYWSFENNMLENTMGIFVLSAVILIYQSLHSERIRIIKLVFAGVFIFMATLSKGFPGFFPIIIPFLFWIIFKKHSFSKALLQSIIIISVPLIVYFILFKIPESSESLSAYIFKRVLQRISNDHIVGSRFYILVRLFAELIPQLLFVGILFSIVKIKKMKTQMNKNIKTWVFFLLIGLSASVPLMLTLVQKGFYFVPALPFFAIGLAVFISPIIINLMELININGFKFKIFRGLSAILLIAVISFSIMQKGKFGRHKELLHDVYLIGKVVPQHTSVSVPRDIWNNWDMQCYLIRYFNISLIPELKNNYCIIDNTIKEDTLVNYTKVDIPTIQYDLYKRKDTTYRK